MFHFERMRFDSAVLEGSGVAVVADGGTQNGCGHIHGLLKKPGRGVLDANLFREHHPAKTCNPQMSGRAGQGLSILQEVLCPCPFALPVTLPPCLHPSPIFTIVIQRLKSVPPPSCQPFRQPTLKRRPLKSSHQPAKTINSAPKTSLDAPICPHASPSIPTQMGGNERK